ncbi:hypothetical protein V8G54_012742, partial [Vigna mungo]
MFCFFSGTFVFSLFSRRKKIIRVLPLPLFFIFYFVIFSWLPHPPTPIISLILPILCLFILVKTQPSFLSIRLSPTSIINNGGTTCLSLLKPRIKTNSFLVPFLALLLMMIFIKPRK